MKITYRTYKHTTDANSLHKNSQFDTSNITNSAEYLSKRDARARVHELSDAGNNK